jgi:nanoRNase/pAp phosphatase (c-di-AMP/oligoRNAs hydrolase)
MEKALEILRRRNKLIMIHRSADPDALGSAIAVSSLFGGKIDISGGINRIARQMFDIFDIDWVENPEFSEYDTIVILDTASPNQLYKVPDRVSLVIDHHMDSGEWSGAEHRLIDEKAWSCTQIIKRMLDRYGIDMDQKVALALLIGMYTDTKGLSMGDAPLLKDVLETMDISKVDLNFLKNITRDEHDSVRISVMKGMQRLRFRIHRHRIIAWTRANSYEGAVANKMIDVGVDIALVGSERDGLVRVIGRASDAAIRSGIHLGRIFSSMGYIMDGEGGGHQGAAGFTAVGDVEYILKMTAQRIEEEMNSLVRDKV